ncbi:hypothetical protein [Neobacillus muris]|uniref:hypothetical protein n=1 Tax=Neobacillus muris TaxID=2941334 RepID=UPI00203C8E95|nr:hypothetical protein [Neobacillus muris]
MQEIKSTVTDQQLELKVVSGTKSDLEKAHNLGMTTGKYQLAHTDDNKGENKKNSHPKMETSPQQSTNSSANQEAASGTAPPGQAKKQTEPSVPQNPNPSASSTPHNGSENETHPEKSNIPQGQMKKWGEQSVKQNPGQIKKQNNGNIQQGQMKKPQPQTFRQNSGQIKKQENWNKAPSGGKNQPKRFENNNKK